MSESISVDAMGDNDEKQKQFSIKQCNVCGATEKLKRCNRCKHVAYCNKEHQIRDWPKHRINCSKINEQIQIENERKSEAMIKDSTSSMYDNFDPRPLNPTCADICDEIGDYKRQELMVEEIWSHLRTKGFCVIDQPFSAEIADGILDDFHLLQKNVEFRTGEVSGGLTSDAVTEKKVVSHIRGDAMSWISDSMLESYKCENIAHLLITLDALLMYFQKYDKTRIISGRTKLMAACYPGSGSGYKRHVDNPNQDGRLFTCLYYLNKNWTEEKGGFLRLFPESENPPYADICPQFNRMVVFWSDRRNPHEVRPSFEDRRALTVWYFDKGERQLAQEKAVKGEMSQVQQQLSLINLETKKLEKSIIEEKIIAESMKAVNSLSDDELKSFANTLAKVSEFERETVLAGMGIGHNIACALISHLKFRQYLK